MIHWRELIKMEILLLGIFAIGSLLSLFYHFNLLVRGMNVIVNNKKMEISKLFVALYFILDLSNSYIFSKK
ncbi:hypothetical protein J2X77_002838 [Sphingobacterium sp. 2149]|nr:hypothetical protein [Sphingobacterium sp. 2149]